MSTERALLRVDQLAARIGKARIVESVNIAVDAGEVVGLAGRNGAGKTTTLRTISGVLARYAGTVTLDGVELRGKPEDIARAGLAHVPEGRGIFAGLTVGQNLRIGLMAARPKRTWNAEQAWREFPALERFADSTAGRLSGGEQQMVALARGLIGRPKVLMVDEMSLGLSPKALGDAMRALADAAANDGIGVLLVDQNTRVLTEWCSRIYLLEHGSTRTWNGSDDLKSTYFEG